MNTGSDTEKVPGAQEGESLSSAGTTLQGISYILIHNPMKEKEKVK